jgi:hypothetical protein
MALGIRFVLSMSHDKRFKIHFARLEDFAFIHSAQVHAKAEIIATIGRAIRRRRAHVNTAPEITTKTPLEHLLLDTHIIPTNRT